MLEAITVDSVWPLQYVFSTGPRYAKPEKNQKLRMMMPSHWPSYILVLVAALLGWITLLGLPRLWWFIGRSAKFQGTPQPATLPANPTAPPISVRFHLAALLFLGFLGIMLIGLPLLFSIRSEQGLLASFVLAGIILPMVIVLFYCLRKGDLSWSASRTRENFCGGRDE